jgi:DNA replicative helicase MCM subunit Mcm2 (Cdc46/Mcm family)
MCGIATAEPVMLIGSGRSLEIRHEQDVMRSAGAGERVVAIGVVRPEIARTAKAVVRKAPG